MEQVDQIEQGRLIESNVVSLAEFRASRPPVSPDQPIRQLFPVKPRPVSMRSIAHQARMLAHLMETGNKERPSDVAQGR